MQQQHSQGQSAEIDRRIELRHAIERDCRITTAALPAGGINGITTNVSRSGMLVRFPGLAASRLLPSVGQEACIQLDLPASMNHTPRALECSASVVRTVQRESDTPALAFEIHSMKILDRSPARPTAGRKQGGELVQ